jgi:hypothetical protein
MLPVEYVSVAYQLQVTAAVFPVDRRDPGRDLDHFPSAKSLQHPAFNSRYAPLPRTY